MNRKAILVISFGTRYQETREKALNAIENDIQAAFPEYEFRRAYTSPTIIRILKSRGGEEVDNVEQALTRLWKDGCQTVIAQTTHIIHGFEYHKMMKTIEGFRDKFEQLVCGVPLLTSDDDYRQAVRIVGQELKDMCRAGTDVLLMGHGTEHAANMAYAKLQAVFFAEGLLNYLVGTVEASPTLENMAALVQERTTHQVVLTPFMIVAGQHAYYDMAGEQEDSWKSRFERNGYQVECVMKGLGEYQGIRDLYIRHAKEAEAKLKSQWMEDELKIAEAVKR